MSEAHLPLESGPRDQPAACHFKGQRLRAYIGSVVGIVGYPKPKSRCRWLLSLESSTIRPGFSDQECDADEAVRTASVVSGASACRENGSGRVPGRGGHLVQRKSRKSTENVMRCSGNDSRPVGGESRSLTHCSRRSSNLLKLISYMLCW
jgi:hypothetical protein